MKGQTLRYIIATLSLLLLSVSAGWAQAPATPEEQKTVLLNDAEAIPSDFARLAQQLDFKKWNPSCSADGVEIAKNSIETYTRILKEADYLAGTVRAGHGWSLSEVAETSYAFGVGVPINMILSRTAACTGQKGLSDDFLLFALRLVDSTDNAHTVEMRLIQDKEDLIDNLKNPKKQPAVPPVTYHANV
jgi:hypothetical protein